MSTIVKGSNYMQAVLYTGTGATQTIGGLDFQPDFVWIKSRSAATDHKLTDAVRGVTKALVSNSTAAETTDTTGITAFTSTGFTLGASSTYNNSGATYVAWCWKAGDSSSSNTDGTITSTVSVNPTAGFSVVTFNIGSSVPPATVGHGLGVAPKLIIAKDRTAAGGWPTFHASATNQNQYLVLNGTGAVASATNVWGSSLPTSSVFGVTAGVTLGASSNCVAYCWSEIDGFSKFGSYTGNGSADGTFVYCGFRPRYIMIKRTDTTANWIVYDTARDTFNAATKDLFPNSSTSEIIDNLVDVLSNGFKLRQNSTTINASGGSYIYAAFAENPFKQSLAR